MHYNRYLKSFEELNRTLGCTMVMAPLSRGRHQSGNVNRVQVRGHRGHRHHLVQQYPIPDDADEHTNRGEAILLSFFFCAFQSM